MTDARVKYILAKLSDNLNFTDHDIIDDWYQKRSGEEVAKVTNFFSPDGPPALFFYTFARQPLEILISDNGSEYPGEKCIFVPYFMRIEVDKQGITQSNLENSVVAGIIHGDPIEAFCAMFRDAYLPAVNSAIASSDEDIDKREIGVLVSAIERKAETVANSVVATYKAIKFDPPSNIGEVSGDGASIIAASRDEQIVSKFEAQCKLWCGQLQGLLTVTERVRQEDETSGPRAEMDYWRERMSIFASLVETLKDPETNIVVSVLKAGKSSVVTLWNELDLKITESASEAKDNVKFLSSLEKYTEMFYSLDPQECQDLIPGLITSVSMVHNISRFYKSPHRICTLLKKVTSQLINRCVAYIMADTALANQDRSELIEKLNACVALNEMYQKV